MVQDVKKAYFFADATRKLYVELPPEEYKAGKCGRLLKSLYGTRDAGAIWEAVYTDVLRELGFEQGAASPCCFYHRGLGAALAVHGDDFTAPH